MFDVVCLTSSGCSSASMLFRCSSSSSPCRRNGDENWKCKYIADQWQHQYYWYPRWGSKSSSANVISYSIITYHSHRSRQLIHLSVGDVLRLVTSATLLNTHRDTNAKWMPSCTASIVLIFSLSLCLFLSLEFLFILLPIVIEFFISLFLFSFTLVFISYYISAPKSSHEK